MQAIHQTITTWQSIDKKVFASEEECREYESNMSRVDYFSYSFPRMIPATKDEADKIQLYCYGYTSHSSHTKWEPGGFLREAGEVVYHSASDTILEYVFANWEEALNYAVTDEKFWKHHRGDIFIRNIKFTDLSDRSR